MMTGYLRILPVSIFASSQEGFISRQAITRSAAAPWAANSHAALSSIEIADPEILLYIVFFCPLP
jgi:hypothetical protein